MDRIKLLIFTLILLLLPLQARDSANVILVLDNSGSMQNNYSEVKSYIKDHILTTLQKDDFFFFIQFGETVDYHYADIVDESSIQDMQEILDKSQADQDFTDIGLALETMLYTLKQSHKVNDKSILLFITDGKNTPPPSSKYSKKEYEYQKVFFEKADYLKDSLWKVMKIIVLGIGEDTEAKNLSELLDGEYIEVSSKVSISQLSDAIGDYLGHLEMFFEPDLGKISRSDVAVPFIVESTYNKDQFLVLTNAVLQNLEIKNKGEWIPVNNELSLDSGFPLKLKVNPLKTTHNKLIMNIPGELSFGEYRGRINVGTEKKHSLLYSDFQVVFHKVHSPLYWIMIIVISLLALGGGTYFIVRRFR